MATPLRGLLTPPIVITATVVVAVAAVAVTYIATKSQPVGSYTAPTMGPLVEEVDSTGSVKAADTIDLGFQIGGRIVNAGPSVGTHVGAGQTLGALSSADLEATLEGAEASLAVQEANLSSLQTGARPEDIAVSEATVSGAQTSVKQAKASLLAAAQDAYAKSDSAIHTSVDQFFNAPRSNNPSLVFNINNSALLSQIVTDRISMETLLSSWNSYLTALPSDTDQIDVGSLASTTHDNLEQVNSYLNLVAEGLTDAIPSTTYPAATITGYESAVATARTNITTDLSSLASAQTAETAAESALASAQSALALKQAPATPQSLQAQEAQVAAAQSSVDAAKAQLGKTLISAPISGTITVNNMEPGEIANSGATEISMISDTKFQFETYVSQADLGKIAVGDAAQVQFDAYENQSPLTAHVISIDPAATVQNGVSSYKVTLQFDQNDPRIQEGLTGSAKITTRSLQSVMSIPSSAIITEGNDHFVIVKRGGVDIQVPVTVGISSASGYTQIVSGLSQTDEVRTFGVQQ